MKVIFLDVDGVLNHWDGLSQYGWHYIDTNKIALVKKIVDATDAQIVLSSTWRIKNENYIRAHSALLTHGLEIYDVTPQTFSGHRSYEISLWLEEKAVMPIEKYAIIDDDLDARGSHKDSYFQTWMTEGLREDIADKVIAHLNKE